MLAGRSILINGLGRIGRTILRIIMTSDIQKDIDVITVNDIATPAELIYLLKYDSVFGVFPGSINPDGDALIINGRKIRLSNTDCLSKMDLSDIDLVMECTGLARDRKFAEKAVTAGANKVLISGPCPTADISVVYGVNDNLLTDQKIVSNGSCTTNALAPLLSILDNEFGLQSGHMNTIHCYTGSQPTVDVAAGGFERSRAAALSMVPTTTSASDVIDSILPHLKGRVSTSAIRVPTASVSAIELSFVARKIPLLQTINALIARANPKVIGTIDEPLVSCDLRGRAESVVVSLRETKITKGGHVRVFGWYDNEWAFAHRMIDVMFKLLPRMV